MSIPTEAATLPTPPAGGGTILGFAAAPPPQDGTFEGDLDDGDTVDLVLVDMKARERDNTFKPGEKRKELVWLFAVEGRENEGLLPWYTSFSLHEKSHFPPTCAALGRPVPGDGEGVDKEKFLRARCRGLVETKTSKGGKDYPKIAKLLKAKKEKKS